MKNKTISIPLIVYENEMKYKTSIITKLITVLITLIICFGITIYLFISFINSYDYVEYNQDGEGFNNINSGYQGDVVNGSKITEQK